jgi:SpoIID/LytB domain protein
VRRVVAGPTNRRRTAVAVAVALAATLGLGPASPAAAAAVPDSFTFTGSGWGHGYGMSQYGAYGMALDGSSATDILQHYYAPATVTRTTDDPEVRVQVLKGVTTVTLSLGSVDSSKAGSWRLVWGPAKDADGNETQATTIPGGSLKFTITTVNGVKQVAATVGGTVRRTSSTMPELYVEWSGTRYLGGNAGLVTVPGANAGSGSVTYRWGRLGLKMLDDGTIQVVNAVKLNTEYVYGIAEMPSSWPSAALQAQAVAARTYALRKYQDDSVLTDETSSQKYTAWNKANETSGGTVWGKRWTAAVDATVDKTGAMVVTNDGAVINASYSSSTGGKTTAAVDATGHATAYLKSQDDHWSLDPRVKNSKASWTATKTQSQVKALFPALSDVARVVVAAKASSGAVKTLRATSSTGQTQDLGDGTTEYIRTKLGLNSAYFSVGSRSDVQRLAGSDRYGTAVAIGRQAFPTGTEVVMVSATSLVDGLVAAPFARSIKAPVLLGDRNSVPQATLDELARRGATHVWLVGGKGVLSGAVSTQLKALGLTVDRLSGDDRYGTAAAVAKKIGTSTTVLVASGMPANLVDAAAAGGPAAAAGQPVLLTMTNALPDVTSKAIAAAGATAVLVVGGTGSVSKAVVTALGAQGVGVARASGSDRYGTAAAVADRYASRVGTDTVLVAAGADANLVDSLTGGVLGHVTLLAGTNGPATTIAWLAAHQPPLLQVAGGTGAVSNAVVEKLR